MNFSVYFPKKIFKYIAIIFLVIVLLVMGITIAESLIMNDYFESNSTVTVFYIVFFLSLSFILFMLIFPHIIKKKTITLEKFKEKLELKGYVVSDITNEFIGSEHIIKVYSATNKKISLQLYILEDDQSAKQFYIDTVLNVENKKENIKQKANTNFGNHSKFSILTHSKYITVSKVGNTVIYIETSSFSEKETKEILKEIGY